MEIAYIITGYPVTPPPGYTIKELLFDKTVAIIEVDEETVYHFMKAMKKEGIAYQPMPYVTQAQAHDFAIKNLQPPPYVYLLARPCDAVNAYIGFGASIVAVLPNALIIRSPEEHADWNLSRLASGMYEISFRKFATKDEAISFAAS
jgi:hypothetical protein